MASIFARELVNQGQRILLVAMTNAATDHLAIVAKGLGVQVVRHYSASIAEANRDPTLSTSATCELKEAKCVATTAAAAGSVAIKDLIFDVVFVDEVNWENIQSNVTSGSFSAASWWSLSV